MLCIRGFRVPTTVYTMFNKISITKLFTAVAILQFVDPEKLALADRIMEVIDLI